jgi:hypothetical protein
VSKENEGEGKQEKEAALCYDKTVFGKLKLK